MPRTFKEALTFHLQKPDGSRLALKAIAEGSGVSYEQLKKVMQRESASTNVDEAVRVANYFGLTLDEFLADETATIRADIVDLYNQLSDQERRFLRDASQGILARRHLDKK